MAYYELVNLSTGNWIGEYSTREAALEQVQIACQRRGPDSIATIGLGYHDDQGHAELIAEGDELVGLALHPRRIPA